MPDWPCLASYSASSSPQRGAGGGRAETRGSEKATRQFRVGALAKHSPTRSPLERTSSTPGGGLNHPPIHPSGDPTGANAVMVRPPLSPDSWRLAVPFGNPSSFAADRRCCCFLSRPAATLRLSRRQFSARPAKQRTLPPPCSLSQSLCLSVSLSYSFYLFNK